MIKSINIKNFKSIEEVDIDLGRINVFIGENGAGKSNILEALALAGAASAEKLDNEFLTSRGIRVTQASFMHSAFPTENLKKIELTVKDEAGNEVCFNLNNKDEDYAQWECETSIIDGSASRGISSFHRFLDRYFSELPNEEKENFAKNFRNFVRVGEPELVKDPGRGRKKTYRMPVTFDLKASSPMLAELYGVQLEKISALQDFIIFSPENSALRAFEREGQIEPLGINGEGLLKLLSVMSRKGEEAELRKIKDALKLFAWFEDFTITPYENRDRMLIKDRYIDRETGSFDPRSANEGFLFASFYFALFCSHRTPKFFAVDNIDASLNPKLCERIVKTLVKLAKHHDKQAIFTTHSPATLDGLNLDDPEQRLFIVSRGRSGQTRVRRYMKPANEANSAPTRLSEAFLSGALGGLPRGF